MCRWHKDTNKECINISLRNEKLNGVENVSVGYDWNSNNW